MNSRRSTTIIAAASLVALLAGCSSNDQPEPVSTGITSQTTSPPDDSQATTSPPDSSDATSSPDAGSATSGEDVGAADAALPTVPAEYADAFVRAWGSGDQTTMTRLGTSDAVASLDSHGDTGGPHWDQTSAEGAAGSTIVTYTNTESGDTLELRVQNETASQGAEHAVMEARYAAAADKQDAVPTVPTDYADALVVAWGTHDQSTMERLATTEVINTLDGHGSPHWDRISAEGAAGSTIVTYEETQTHEVLTLRVENALASQGAHQAVVEARFEEN